MESIAVIEKSRRYLPVKKNISVAKKTAHSPMVHGLYKKMIKAGIWINIFLLALYTARYPLKIFRALKKLRDMRDSFRGNHSIIKYAKVDNKFYHTFYAPGWPSKAFSKYIIKHLQKLDSTNTSATLQTVLFAITKKCGYKCEHCFEWDALNKPETLSREDLLSVIHSFQDLGITQLQLSGGEPLNRFSDMVYILQNIRKGTEVWLFTSGYKLTQERAAILKREGLTGVSISLDHWIPELHNTFRGRQNAFEWVEQAVANANKHKLVVCLSLCTTNEFINSNNLLEYAELAKKWGVSFIQLLEPRAVGHYAGKDISLQKDKIAMLEDFYTTYNYDKTYNDYPSIVYHGFYNRRVGCGAGGKNYVYIDTDGDVHNCPFCQRKLFSALRDPIHKNVELMMSSGCSIYTSSTQKN